MVTGRKIRVLIVDDSIMFRTAISRGLEEFQEISVVGTSPNTYDARDKIVALRPDVVTLDVEMPGMNGIEFLKILMSQSPMPVIMVSGVNGIVFDALRAGAVDFVEKPSLGMSNATFVAGLAEKIKAAAVAKLGVGLKQPLVLDHTEQPKVAVPVTTTVKATWSTNCLIAIGASTGGTEATSQLLKALPEGMPGMVITQHMPPKFTKMYADRLNRECKLTVDEARDGDVIRPGYAFVAPGDMQLRVAKRGTDWICRVGGTDKVSGHCPSVDVLFESVAQNVGSKAIGIILTGMGADGSKGMLKMHEAGSFTIGQDQQSCVVYGMPMEAKKIGAVTQESSLEVIPSVLLNKLKKGV